VKCGFSTASLVVTNHDEENKMGLTAGHIDCPSTFDKFLNVNKFVPKTDYQLTSLDSPGPSSMHVVGLEERRQRKYASHLAPL
jgi:hypothetical protein